MPPTEEDMRQRRMKRDASQRWKEMPRSAMRAKASMDDEVEIGEQSNVKVQISLNGNQTIFGSELTKEDTNEARQIAKEALKKKSIFL